MPPCVALIGYTGNGLYTLYLGQSDAELLNIFHVMHFYLDLSFEYAIFRFNQQADDVDIEFFGNNIDDFVQISQRVNTPNL